MQRMLLREAHCSMRLISATLPAASPARALALTAKKSPSGPHASAATRAHAASAAARCPAASASICRIAWNFAIGRPNCSRSPAYLTERSSARRIAPTIWKARIRSPNGMSPSVSSGGAGRTRSGCSTMPVSTMSALGSLARLAPEVPQIRSTGTKARKRSLEVLSANTRMLSTLVPQGIRLTVP